MNNIPQTTTCPICHQKVRVNRRTFTIRKHRVGGRGSEECEGSGRLCVIPITEQELLKSRVSESQFPIPPNCHMIQQHYWIYRALDSTQGPAHEEHPNATTITLQPLTDGDEEGYKLVEQRYGYIVEASYPGNLSVWGAGKTQRLATLRAYLALDIHRAWMDDAWAPRILHREAWMYPSGSALPSSVTFNEEELREDNKLPALDTTWLVEFNENEYLWADTEEEALFLLYASVDS